MNLSYFISKKIVTGQPGSFSSIVNRIAIFSIGIGLAVMIASTMILQGFKKAVTTKLYSFSGHVEVINYTQDYLFDPKPIRKETFLSKTYQSISNIDHLQRVAYKFGLVKTKEEVSSVIFKGVGDDFYRKGFESNMIQGELPLYKDSTTANQVVVGKKLAAKLELKIGDKVILYFVQNPPRFRKVEIKGIYQSTIDLFDDEFMIGDIHLVQKMNNWGDTLVGSYEIFVNNKSKIDQTVDQIFDRVEFEYYVQKISDKYQAIFDWLKIINRNVVIFLALILLVAAFNMAVVLLILIMERTSMIGILKALGSSNKLIRRIFFYNGIWLVFKGLLLGNIIGLGFCFIQYYFHLIPLDPESYHVDSVPIAWDFLLWIGLNGLVITVSSIILILPTILASRMSPVKAIRFD